MNALAGIDTAQEEAAIRALLDRYTDAVNRRDWETYQACWAEEGVWDLGAPLNIKKEGIQAIMQEVTTTVNNMEFFTQMTHSVVVNVLDEARATARVTLNEIGRTKGDALPFPGLFILAMYFDELVKRNDRWVFAKRTYQVFYFDPSAPQGQAYQSGWLGKGV